MVSRWTLLTAMLWAGSVSAFDRKEIDAYCDFLDYSHSAQAAQYLTPSLFSTFTRSAVPTNSATPVMDVQRLRVGAEYDLISIGKYSVLNGLRSAACDRARAEAIFEVASDQTEVETQVRLSNARIRGLEAKRDILIHGLELLERATNMFQKRFKDGSATVRDMEAVMSGVTLARTSLADDNFELEQARRQQARASQKHAAIRSVLSQMPIDNPVQAARGRLEEALQRELRLQRQKELLDGVSLNLAAAYQSLTNPTYGNQGGSTYVGFEMRMNLGAVFASFGGAEVEKHLNWVRTRRPEKLPEHETYVTVDDQVHHLGEKLPGLEEHEHALKEVMQTAQFDEATILTMPAAARSYSLFLLASANAQQARTELKNLREVSSLPVPAPTQQAAIEPEAEAALDPKLDSGQWIHANQPKFRRDQAAEFPFRATATFKIVEEMIDAKALGSGAVRHQLGLMLVRKNQCNMLYVMVRLGRENTIAVQDKTNPGSVSHGQCENRGYRTIDGTELSPVGPLQKGETHTLSAEAGASQINVWLDGRLVWKSNGVGTIHSGNTIGFRTDNMVVDYTLTDAPRPSP
ncbi:hypothetical protein K2X33_12585 [bacterium]|nr:hypothetical protein [bacterium]